MSRRRLIPDAEWELYWWGQWARPPSDLGQTRALRLDSERTGQPIRVLDRKRRGHSAGVPDDRNERKAVLAAWRLAQGDNSKKLKRWISTEYIAEFVRDANRRHKSDFAKISDVALGPVLVGLGRFDDLAQFAGALERQVDASTARRYIDASVTFVSRVYSHYTDIMQHFPTNAEDDALSAVSADQQRAAWLRIGRRGEPEVVGPLADAVHLMRSLHKQRLRDTRGDIVRNWLLECRIVLPLIAMWVADGLETETPLFDGLIPSTYPDVLARWVLRHEPHEPDGLWEPFEDWSER